VNIDPIFAETPVFPYTHWQVAKIVALTSDGVTDGVVLYLQCVMEELTVGVMLHPDDVVKVCADLLSVVDK